MDARTRTSAYRTAITLIFALAPTLFVSRSYAQTAGGPSGPAPATSSSGDGSTRGALMPTAPAATPTAPPVVVSDSSTKRVDPAADASDLERQGSERPANDGGIPARANEVFSEDWWGRTRPVFEIHGYFRTRAELFHNFTLGRHGDVGGSPTGLWAQPLDNTYQDVTGQYHSVALCGSTTEKDNCSDKTQSGANMRFRVAPELHISDNLRILSEIDLLDNVVLGSTPDAYAIQPSEAVATTTTTGTTTASNHPNYTSAGYNNSASLGAFTSTTATPTAGINSFQNSISVKRVWAEYQSPVGLVRFGRMPNQWGLGMVDNAGNGIDSDYQSTTDRIMFLTGIKPLGLYVAGMWDFVNSGPTSASAFDAAGGQPYNTCNLCNVNQWGIQVVRKMDPELQKLSLAHGNIVVNGGVYTTYRSQYLDLSNGATPITAVTTDQNTAVINNNLARVSAWAITPDAWVQVLYNKFRFEAEGVANYGSIQIDHPTTIQQFGFTAQSEYRALEDKLHVDFGFGWASGDPWSTSLTSTTPQNNRSNTIDNSAISTFRFNPDYRVDLIFFRHILSRVEGAYYFRPSVDYDFLKTAAGQKFGGGAAFVWSRASEFVQTPGHKRDLGVELDVQLYYQAKDGSFNDNPAKVGGFYTMLQYGVFFPLPGLDYLPGVSTSGVDLSTSIAQTIRLFLGVAY